MGEPDTQKIDAPPPSVREVTVAVDVNEDGRPVYAPLSSDGTTKVVTTTSFTIRFDRFLLPATVIRQSLCIRSSLDPVTKAEECAGGLFLEPSYDPTRREAVYWQSSTDERLKPNTTYTLTILPALVEGSPSGFRAFDGAALQEPVVYQFSTLAADPPGAVLETLPEGDLFCKPQDCLDTCAASKQVTMCQAACPSSCAATCMCDPNDATCINNCPADDATCKESCKTCRSCKDDCLSPCTASCPSSVASLLGSCAFGGCHLNSPSAEGGSLLAAMGLDLSKTGIALTAINQVAKQTQQGEHADEPDRTPRRFGRAMPLIDAASPERPGGNPGNSYLLYKLAIGVPPSTPEEAAEIERLRASVVVGMPMPIPPGQPLRDVDLSAISTWIAQGAPMPLCQ